jgi:hypothetical protein
MVGEKEFTLDTSVIIKGVIPPKRRDERHPWIEKSMLPGSGSSNNPGPNNGYCGQPQKFHSSPGRKNTTSTEAVYLCSITNNC